MLKQNEQFIKHYLLEMKLINQSPKTIRVKKLVIEMFCKWCEQQDIDLTNVTGIVIKEWIGELQGNIKASTINARIKYLRNFYNFLVEEGDIRRSPLEKIRLLKEDKVSIKTYTDGGVKKMLGYYKNTSFKGARGKLILMLLASTGIRNMTLRDIRLSDLKDDYITVRVKGKKEQIVPLALAVQKQLFIYMKFRNKLKYADKSDFLIVSSLSGLGIGEKLIVRTIADAGKECGIKENLTCHQFRRYFAQALINDSVSLYEVSRLLHHENIQTTTQYLTSMQDEQVVNKAIRYNPINKLL